MTVARADGERSPEHHNMLLRIRYNSVEMVTSVTFCNIRDARILDHVSIEALPERAMSADPAKDQRIALTATTAQRCSADVGATTMHFVQQRECQAIARCANGVSQRNGSAVDVHHVIADAKVGHARQSDRRKGFVDLEQSDLIE